jgi:hypothetical protein
LKPAWANSSRDPILKKPITKKSWWSDSRWGPWVQTPVPQKEKKRKNRKQSQSQEVGGVGTETRRMSHIHICKTQVGFGVCKASSLPLHTHLPLHRLAPHSFVVSFVLELIVWDSQRLSLVHWLGWLVWECARWFP